MHGSNGTGYRYAWAAIASAAVFFSAGCGGAVTEEGDAESVAVDTSEVKDGTLYDGSNVWRGAVGLSISSWWGDSSTCSGQIVSQRTILTAAHCVIPMSRTNPGTGTVSVWRESAGGLVTVLPATQVTVFYNPAYNIVDPPYDMALLTIPSGQSFQNVTSTDAAVLAKTTPTDVTMRAFGYGYFGSGDNDYDSRGRSLSVVPTYASRQLEYYYLSPSGQAQLCAGDSGGALKHATSGSLVYGIYSRRYGGTGVCQPGARWAATARNISWLRGNIAGTCQETSTTYRCW